MRTVYILEYKSVDSKGREKNARHVGAFSDLEGLELAKQAILKKYEDSKISFHVHANESWF